MINALFKTLSTKLISIFPPETTAHVFLPLQSTFPDKIAATGVAPAPSATTLLLSIKNKIASAISASETVTTSSTYFFTNSKVLHPTFLTAIPSAIVGVAQTSQHSPFAKAAVIEAAFSASTPITFTFGFIPFIAVAIPARIPPPPIGTNTVSISAISSNISIPIVPCPAIIYSSSNGCKNTAPVAF